MHANSNVRSKTAHDLVAAGVHRAYRHTGSIVDASETHDIRVVNTIEHGICGVRTTTTRVATKKRPSNMRNLASTAKRHPTNAGSRSEGHSGHGHNTGRSEGLTSSRGLFDEVSIANGATRANAY